MMTFSRQFLVLVVLAAMTAGFAQGDGRKGDNKLLGTWKLKSAQYGGREFRFDEGTAMVKHVTPSQFMWATYDKDGKITRAAGGGYSLKGETYEETPEYGISDDFNLIKGKPQTFKWKVQGDEWHHDGN